MTGYSVGGSCWQCAVAPELCTVTHLCTLQKADCSAGDAGKSASNRPRVHLTTVKGEVCRLECGAQGVAIHQSASLERRCKPLQGQDLLLRKGEPALHVQLASMPASVADSHSSTAHCISLGLQHAFHLLHVQPHWRGSLCR